MTATLREGILPLDPDLTPHIYLPPETIIKALGEMANDVLTTTRDRLADSALAIHGMALAYSTESGRAADIPSGVLWPSIVSHEVMATMALLRRQAGKQVVRHPTDPTKHLIVNRKPDILGVR